MRRVSRALTLVATHWNARIDSDPISALRSCVWSKYFVEKHDIFANRELDATQRKALRQYCEPALSLLVIATTNENAIIVTRLFIYYYRADLPPPPPPPNYFPSLIWPQYKMMTWLICRERLSQKSLKNLRDLKSKGRTVSKGYKQNNELNLHLFQSSSELIYLHLAHISNWKINTMCTLSLMRDTRSRHNFGYVLKLKNTWD